MRKRVACELYVYRLPLGAYLLTFRSTERHRQLKKSFMSLLPDNERNLRIKNLAKIKRSANIEDMGRIIHQEAESTITSGKAFMAQYRKICEQVSAARENSSIGKHEWGGDVEKLQSIIQKQGEKVKLEVNHLVQENVEDTGEETLGDEDQELWDRFAVTSTQEKRKTARSSELGWAVAAKNARRGVRRMLMDLPHEEGE